MTRRLSLRITTLLENTVLPEYPDLLSEHGLSFLLETGGKRILFDTGQSGAFLHNAEKLGITPPLSRDLDAVVLSHGHYDHAGGLMALAGASAGGFDLYTGAGAFTPRFSERKGAGASIGIPFLREELEACGVRIHESLPGTEIEIAPGLFICPGIPFHPKGEPPPRGFFTLTDTGPAAKPLPDEFPDEQICCFASQNGTVVISGCAHRGILNTLRYVSARFPDQPVYAVLGGLHLLDAGPVHLQYVAAELDRMNIRFLGIGHCTGARAVRLLAASRRNPASSGEAGGEAGPLSHGRVCAVGGGFSMDF